MKIQTFPAISPGRQVAAGSRKACHITDCAVAAIGAGVFAVAVSASAADPGTGHSVATAVPSQPASAGWRQARAHPIDFPDADPALSAQRDRIVEQLYQELMRRRSSDCSLASTYSSAAGGC